MARTHTPINAQKKHTRTDAAVPPPSNAACQCPADQGVSGPWETSSWWTHRSFSSLTMDRSSYLWETSIIPSWYRSANLLWVSTESVYLRQGTKPPTTHHHVALLQAVERHCHLAAATQEKTSSVCSVLMHGWLHLSAFHFFPKLGVCLLFYSCGWQWGMVSESRGMYRDEQHVL